jgi:hypothetical protein
MIDTPDNLVLEHLRAIRAHQAKHDELFGEVLSRLLRLEQIIAGLKRDQASGIESDADLQSQIDRIRRDLDRVQRRLELIPGDGAPEG